MQGFLAGGARAGPAVDHSIAPANLDTSIVQPTDPIVKYCYILSIDSSNNKTYKCKQCGKTFKGQPCSVGSHFKKGFSTQEVQDFLCTNVNAEKFGYSPLNKSLQ
jgi:hypothetical protein